MVCLLCLGLEENFIPLFFTCLVEVQVWKQLFLWIGVGPFAPFVSASDHVAELLYLLSNKVRKPFGCIFWWTLVWLILLVRNEILFKGGHKGFWNIVDMDKSLA